ncbi:MAG: ESX secretion-associated protein EspG [Mycobacterium sp.]|nr:ESX secretion-associated protein EspG [Mycobacterium sp.]
MLTTTIDGLWVLQILAGVETIAPELGLRAVLPRFETKEAALAHPVAAELRQSGAIDDSGQVDTAIVDWLTVLSRRDVALIFYINTPTDEGLIGVVLARFAQWWVSIERVQSVVRIGPAGTASTESSANTVIRDQIERLLGVLEPAPLRPVTLDADQIVDTVKNPESLGRFLGSQRVDADQQRLLMLAADTSKSACASIVAAQAGAGKSHIEHGSVTIFDTPEGRILIEHAPQGGKLWMIASPGSAGNIVTAINTMVRRLPAKEEWYSHRKIY